MPSCFSRSRSCAIVIWFCCATLATARSSSGSSTRAPLSRALVTRTRSSTSASSTCLRSAGAGGSGVRLRAASSRMRARRCCTSLAVTSSWLATAIAAAASARRRKVGKSVIRGIGGRRGALLAQQLVAGHIVLQDTQRTRSDPREADEFQLQQEPRRLLAAPGRQPLDDDAADPAAGVVLEADDAVGEAAVARAVVEVADAVERAAAAALRRARAGVAARRAVDRPLPADRDLLRQAARQAVGRADGAERPR